MLIEHTIRIGSGEVKITHWIEGGSGSMKVQDPGPARSVELGESAKAPVKTFGKAKPEPSEEPGAAAPSSERSTGMIVVIGPVIVVSGGSLSGLGEGGGGEFGSTSTEGLP